MSISQSEDMSLLNILVNFILQPPRWHNSIVYKNTHAVHPWPQQHCTSRPSQRQRPPLRSYNAWQRCGNPLFARGIQIQHRHEHYESDPYKREKFSYRSYCSLYTNITSNYIIQTGITHPLNICWCHNITCETRDESLGSRTGHSAKQRCRIAMTLMKHRP
jgi:hypothetical protein